MGEWMVILPGQRYEFAHGGCTALAEADVKTLMRTAHNGMRIYLDEYYE